MSKKPPIMPTTEELETTLRVLRIFAGEEMVEHYPYLAHIAEESIKVRKEIEKTIKFRDIK